MTEKAEKILTEFGKLDWFCHSGEPVLGVQMAKSWKEAIATCQSKHSANVQLESKNLLTENLCFRFPDRYHGKWNPLVVRVSKKTDRIVFEKILSSTHCPKLPKRVVDAIQWDLTGIIMELEYADLVPPRFFAERAKWYLAGHFPCGWEGDFPKGRLIVY